MKKSSIILLLIAITLVLIPSCKNETVKEMTSQQRNACNLIMEQSNLLIDDGRPCRNVDTQYNSENDVILTFSGFDSRDFTLTGIVHAITEPGVKRTFSCQDLSITYDGNTYKISLSVDCPYVDDGTAQFYDVPSSEFYATIDDVEYYAAPGYN